MAEARSIREIAQEISDNWQRVNFAAERYLDAMFSLNKITDDYFQESARSIVAYFLANANSWRGDVARRVKAELRELIK